MMSGWTGKMLRVDMTAGTAVAEDIPQEWDGRIHRRTWVGRPLPL